MFKKGEWLEKEYAHIRFAIANGKGHDLVLEAPQVIASVLLCDDIKDVSDVEVVQ